MTGKRDDVKVSTFDVADYLRDDSDAQAFLKLCLEQSPPDGRLVARALGAIARSKGKMSKIAESTGLSRESLYKALSGSRDPGFTTILKVLSALGYSLSLSHKDTAGAAGLTPPFYQELWAESVDHTHSTNAPSSAVATVGTTLSDPLDVQSGRWAKVFRARGHLYAPATALGNPSFTTSQATGDSSTVPVRTLQ